MCHPHIVCMGDYRELLTNAAQQIEEGLHLGENVTVPKSTRRIIFCGMGGSGIIGDVMERILQQYQLEVFICKTYALPTHLLTSNTLVVVISYSGNTVETATCYRTALKAKAKILVAASGGSILSSAMRQKIPCIHLTEGYLPRQSFLLMFFSLLQALVNSDIIPNQTTAINEFRGYLDTYPFARRSNAIAKSIEDGMPIVYTSPDLWAAGLRWKTQINENCKKLCIANSFTELNHNEIEGFDRQLKKHSMVILCRQREPKIVSSNIEVFCQLVRSQVDALKLYEMPGRSLLCALLVGIHLGDWVSYQLAEMNKVDPDDMTLITQLRMKVS
mgnify:CR=1 FL=1